MSSFSCDPCAVSFWYYTIFFNAWIKGVGHGQCIITTEESNMLVNEKDEGRKVTCRGHPHSVTINTQQDMTSLSCDAVNVAPQVCVSMTTKLKGGGHGQLHSAEQIWDLVMRRMKAYQCHCHKQPPSSATPIEVCTKL